jgi:acetoin utilization deacetylase AcuC-like enzyme
MKCLKQGKTELGLIFFPAFDWAISPDHPEREERLLYTRDQVVEEGIFDLPQIREYNPIIAMDEDIERVHFCIPNVETRVTKPHAISAGGAIKAAELVLSGETKRAFAIIRPPGHHAFRVVRGARGFCTINNESIMVEWIRKNYGKDLKIAIIDTDAHHADGTQDIFYHDPNVLHISTHQDGRTLFPGSGFVHEAGGPTAFGMTLNVSLPPYTTDEGFHYCIDNLILPVLEEFKPDIVINDAGQDNHYSDPLTSMLVSAQGYAKATDKLKPDIVILQGGYSIETALPYVNTGLILALAGLDYSHVCEPGYKEMKQDSRITEQIKEGVESAYNLWRTRKKINLESMFTPSFVFVNREKKQFYVRQKQIFYDTDQIYEVQVERVRWHSSCPGYVVIDSDSRGDVSSIRAFSIQIPFNSCAECREDGLFEMEQAIRKLGKNYDLVQLRDLQRGLIVNNYNH